MERLKALYEVALTPIIVLSAREPAAARERALKAGAIEYFQKPVDNQVFLLALQKALGEVAAPELQ
jgi:CheY-like chemotaxis protein